MLRFSFFTLLLVFVLTGLWTCTTVTEQSNEEVHSRLAGDPDGLNPILARNGYSWQLIGQIFQPLMQFDPISLALKPVLIVAPPEQKTIVDGGVAYTFEIREEAHWDNGNPILAADYIFSLKCILNPQLPNGFGAFFDFLKGVEVDPDNPRKFTVFTDRPYFLSEVVCSNFEIYPEYAYDPDSLLRAFDLTTFLDPSAKATLKEDTIINAFAEHFQKPFFSHDLAGIVGSGPYRMVEWLAGQRIVLEKKKDWWGQDLNDPMLRAVSPRLRYSIIPDVNAAISLLKSGNLDVLDNIPGRQFIAFQDDQQLSQRYHWLKSSQLLYYYIALNKKNPKLEDRRVRKALAYLLNTPELIEQVMYGLAEPTIGPFSPQSPYYHNGLRNIEFQIDTAKKMLAEAGWKDSDGNGILDKELAGKKTELTLSLEVSTGSETGKSVALLFQGNARKAGIAIEVQLMDFSKLSDRLHKGTFEMTYSARGNRPGEVDPTQTWYADKSRGGRNNYFSFGDASSDALIDSLRQSLNREERYRHYRRLQALIYEDQPVLFVFVPQGRLAIHKRFEAEVSQRPPGYFPERLQLKD